MVTCENEIEDADIEEFKANVTDAVPLGSKSEYQLIQVNQSEEAKKLFDV